MQDTQLLLQQQRSSGVEFIHKLDGLYAGSTQLIHLYEAALVTAPKNDAAPKQLQAARAQFFSLRDALKPLRDFYKTERFKALENLEALKLAEVRVREAKRLGVRAENLAAGLRPPVYTEANVYKTTLRQRLARVDMKPAQRREYAALLSNIEREVPFTKQHAALLAELLAFRANFLYADEQAAPAYNIPLPTIHAIINSVYAALSKLTPPPETEVADMLKAYQKQLQQGRAQLAAYAQQTAAKRVSLREVALHMFSGNVQWAPTSAVAQLGVLAILKHTAWVWLLACAASLILGQGLCALQNRFKGKWMQHVLGLLTFMPPFVYGILALYVFIFIRAAFGINVYGEHLSGALACILGICVAPRVSNYLQRGACTLGAGAVGFAWVQVVRQMSIPLLCALPLLAGGLAGGGSVAGQLLPVQAILPAVGLHLGEGGGFALRALLALCTLWAVCLLPGVFLQRWGQQLRLPLHVSARLRWANNLLTLLAACVYVCMCAVLIAALIYGAFSIFSASMPALLSAAGLLGITVAVGVLPIACCMLFSVPMLFRAQMRPQCWVLRYLKFFAALPGALWALAILGVLAFKGPVLTTSPVPYMPSTSLFGRELYLSFQGWGTGVFTFIVGLCLLLLPRVYVHVNSCVQAAVPIQVLRSAYALGASNHYVFLKLVWPAVRLQLLAAAFKWLAWVACAWVPAIILWQQSAAYFMPTHVYHALGASEAGGGLPPNMHAVFAMLLMCVLCYFVLQQYCTGAHKAKQRAAEAACAKYI